MPYAEQPEHEEEWPRSGLSGSPSCRMFDAFMLELRFILLHHDGKLFAHKWTVAMGKYRMGTEDQDEWLNCHATWTCGQHLAFFQFNFWRWNKCCVSLSMRKMITNSLKRTGGVSHDQHEQFLQLHLLVAYKFAKNNRKKMTAAIAMIIAAGQYAQRRRERYENHVEVVMKSGIAHINMAPRPKYC